METIALLLEESDAHSWLVETIGQRFRVVEVDLDQALQGAAELCLLETRRLAERLAPRAPDEATQLESLHKYQALFDQSADGIYLHDLDGRLIDVNQAAAAQSGYGKDELLHMSVFDLHPAGQVPEREAIVQMWHEWDRDQPVVIEAFHQRKDGTPHEVEITTGRVRIGDRDLLLAIVRDIGERKRMEAAQEKLQSQLIQAQKMESVGRLAGGVAHDLNNLLSPVLGYGEILRQDLGDHPSLLTAVDEILRAGSLARDLVQQLLAFSRKQTLSLVPVDIGRVVSQFQSLLRRTIREDIEIEFEMLPDLPPVMADVGQIEQVIMNLAVNAADAMPDGGRLCLETDLVVMGEEDAASRAGVDPGRFVLLAVSDTGCGMDAQIREQIYEPFFSTKGELGTGLGLATVYGIVKQHGGHIYVYSEPGEGTTFKIYLPATDQQPEHRTAGLPSPEDLRGVETILLVEDNDQVRQLAEAILTRHGYEVIQASNGKQMLALADEFTGPAHLLLTDVVLPGINGRELFERMAERLPELKVLYMSGYTQNVIAHRGALDRGVHFLHKPFSVTALLAKVREVLDN